MSPLCKQPPLEPDLTERFRTVRRTRKEAVSNAYWSSTTRFDQAGNGTASGKQFFCGCSEKGDDEAIVHRTWISIRALENGMAVGAPGSGHRHRIPPSRLFMHRPALRIQGRALHPADAPRKKKVVNDPVGEITPPRRHPRRGWVPRDPRKWGYIHGRGLEANSPRAVLQRPDCWLSTKRTSAALKAPLDRARFKKWRRGNNVTNSDYNQ